MTISTDTHSRRVALGALASVPVLAILPAAAHAAPPEADGPDAALFALIAAARDLDARGREAYDAALEAARRTEKAPAPEALIVTEEDTRLWKLNVGALFDEDHLDSMRQRLRKFSSILADAPYVATLDEKDRATLELLAAREAREDQLVAAHDQWNEARRLARDRSGETAAEELQERLYNERCDACDRIALKRALTLNGMLAKLAFIAPDFDAQEELDGGTSEVILKSIAVDYKLGVEGVQTRV